MEGGLLPPGQPEADYSLLGPLLRGFANGGLLGAAKAAGYQPPQWLDAPNTLLQNPDFNAALGVANPLAPARLASAAIRLDGGKIYTAPTHGEAVYKAAQDLGVSLDDLFNKHMRNRGSTDSLFLTTDGRVVTRQEAAAIASQAGQFKPVRSGGYTKAEDINMSPQENGP